MMKILILTAPFYEDIVEGLYKGAEQALPHHSRKRIDVAGAMELPIALSYHMKKKTYDGALSRHMKKNTYDGALVLGCVIQGETDHYQHICRVVTDGVAQLARHHDWAVTLGVVMASSLDLAQARSLSYERENYGYNAGLALISLLEALDDA